MKPRLIKTEAAIGMTLDDLHNLVCAFGENEFAQQGAAPFMWVIQKGNNLAWLETPWENDPEKYASTEFIRAMLKELNADRYSFMTEAWVAVENYEKGGKLPTRDIVPPSQRPANERDDVLMIYSFERSGKYQMTRYKVTIRAHGQNYLGPRCDEPPTDQAGGEMWNLFQPPKRF